MNEQSEQPDVTQEPKPVAYDTDGRPLYHHPPTQQDDVDGDQIIQNKDGYQYVHLRRSLSPEKAEISPEIQKKHDEAKEAYPNLNLTEGEYIIRAISRHPIGLILPVAVSLFLVLLVGAALISLPMLTESIGISPSVYGLLFVIGLMLMLLFAIGGYIAVWVYTNNRFFLTNESVIQEIQTSLFAKHEQTVSLANIEDASFLQEGILPHMFNYGLIRLSTEGDETTYRFNYVSNPKDQVAVLNNAVEAFKNGRPVEYNGN